MPDTTSQSHRRRDRADLLRAWPGLSYMPLVEPRYLEAVVDIVQSLPALSFPVNSAGELLTKYTGTDPIEVAGTTFDPRQTLRYMPAYYFPIASLENFMEKVAELLAARRMSAEIPGELAEIKSQLPRFRCPIASPQDMARSFAAGRVYSFRGRVLIPGKMVHQIPRRFFPITSEADLDRKIRRLLAARPRLKAPAPGERLR